jgi:hypothetical protein
MLSIADQISAILNVFGNKLRIHFDSTIFMTDIQDGTLYNSVESLNDCNNISLSWNCDGVPLFSSSTNEV